MKTYGKEDFRVVAKVNILDDFGVVCERYKYSPEKFVKKYRPRLKTICDYRKADLIKAQGLTEISDLSYHDEIAFLFPYSNIDKVPVCMGMQLSFRAKKPLLITGG
jgi:hypothetical protein